MPSLKGESSKGGSSQSGGPKTESSKFGSMGKFEKDGYFFEKPSKNEKWWIIWRFLEGMSTSRQIVKFKLDKGVLEIDNAMNKPVDLGNGLVYPRVPLYLLMKAFFKESGMTGLQDLKRVDMWSNEDSTTAVLAQAREWLGKDRTDLIEIRASAEEPMEQAVWHVIMAPKTVPTPGSRWAASISQMLAVVPEFKDKSIKSVKFRGAKDFLDTSKVEWIIG